MLRVVYQIYGNLSLLSESEWCESFRKSEILKISPFPKDFYKFFVVYLLMDQSVATVSFV